MYKYDPKGVLVGDMLLWQNPEMIELCNAGVSFNEQGEMYAFNGSVQRIRYYKGYNNYEIKLERHVAHIRNAEYSYQAGMLCVTTANCALMFNKDLTTEKSIQLFDWYRCSNWTISDSWNYRAFMIFDQSNMTLSVGGVDAPLELTPWVVLDKEYQNNVCMCRDQENKMVCLYSIQARKLYLVSEVTGEMKVVSFPNNAFHHVTMSHNVIYLLNISDGKVYLV